MRLRLYCIQLQYAVDYQSLNSCSGAKNFEIRNPKSSYDLEESGQIRNPQSEIRNPRTPHGPTGNPA